MAPQTPDDRFETPTEILAESENYSMWISQDTDGEIQYHLELGGVTMHFFQEEWDEFVKLMKEVISLDSRR